MINKFILMSAILLLGIVSVAGTLYIRENVVKAYKIPAASMEPTLLVGDHILVDRGKASRAPRRGNLIVFEYPKDPSKDFVKRVVAVAGDTVELKDKILLINGKAVKEPYIVHKEKETIPAAENPRDNFPLHKIAADSCFVMGDNRDRSYDSRFWGTVSKDKIKGTVKSIYWSWDKTTLSVRWDRIGKAVQ